jgi:hypothetical protein
MTRDTGIIGIFRQIEHFLNFLVVWGQSQSVSSSGAIHKMTGNLRA